MIGLYPNLIPGELRQQVAEKYPTKPPTLSGDDLEEGIKHLTKYLTQMRYQEVQRLQLHQKAEQQPEDQQSRDHLLPENLFKHLTETLQLIDTTLLKCYIKVGVDFWGVALVCMFFFCRSRITL